MWMPEASENTIALWQEQTLWTDKKEHRKPPVQTMLLIGLRRRTWNARSKVMLKDKWGSACPSYRTAGLPWGEPHSRGSFIDSQSIWNLKLTKWTPGQQRLMKADRHREHKVSKEAIWQKKGQGCRAWGNIVSETGSLFLHPSWCVRYGTPWGKLLQVSLPVLLMIAVGASQLLSPKVRNFADLWPLWGFLWTESWYATPGTFSLSRPFALHFPSLTSVLWLSSVSCHCQPIYHMYIGGLLTF